MLTRRLIACLDVKGGRAPNAKAARRTPDTTIAAAGAIGAVAVADLEVGAEGFDGRGAEFLGDQDDGLAHGRHPCGRARGRSPRLGQF